MTLVRPATSADLPALGRMGAALARQHHGFDPLRFMLLEGIQDGYTWWFTRELENPDAFLRVAVRGDLILGYAYGRIEDRDWNALRDRCGALHDIWVDPDHRSSGVGRALVEAMATTLQGRGMPRVVLSSAAQNVAAQRLFARLGWRPTMVEMTREL